MYLYMYMYVDYRTGTLFLQPSARIASRTIAYSIAILPFDVTMTFNPNSQSRNRNLAIANYATSNFAT